METVGILIKVNKETRKKMRQMHINWSEEIRQFIVKRLNKESDEGLAWAVATTDRLFRKSKNNFDSTEFIRKMRDTRYGPGSR